MVTRTRGTYRGKIGRILAETNIAPSVVGTKALSTCAAIMPGKAISSDDTKRQDDICSKYQAVRDRECNKRVDSIPTGDDYVTNRSIGQCA